MAHAEYGKYGENGEYVEYREDGGCAEYGEYGEYGSTRLPSLCVFVCHLPLLSRSKLTKALPLPCLSEIWVPSSNYLTNTFLDLYYYVQASLL